MRKVIVLLVVVLGCEKMKPELVNIPEYPNMEEVFNQQVSLLEDKKLIKDVWLDGKNESKMFDLDSTGWKKELSFLREINPNTPEYVGAFEKSTKDEFTQLLLKQGEKGELKVLSYVLGNDYYSRVKGTIHEDKEVYSHHRDFDINFQNGLLKEYIISGYQKIVLKDTIKFQIKGMVGN